MDSRKFDALTRAVASATTRRSLIKGLLGLGSLAAIGSIVREEDPAEAARRPTPTRTPVRCPGQQVPCVTGCCCPSGQTKCGPDCCNTTNFPSPDPQHSECCDNACCQGTCIGEEICCPTNNRAGGQGPLAAVCADGSCCFPPNRCVQGACRPPTPTPTNTATRTRTNTPAPPTSTPTNTPAPPTNTSVPPSHTPTDIPAPPSNTPTDIPVCKPNDEPCSSRTECCSGLCYGVCVPCIPGGAHVSLCPGPCNVNCCCDGWCGDEGSLGCVCGGGTMGDMC